MACLTLLYGLVAPNAPAGDKAEWNDGNKASKGDAVSLPPWSIGPFRG